MNCFECYFHWYAWNTWMCLLRLPLTYCRKIYHKVSLQYFYNALFKSATLTKSDVYIQYIFYTRGFFLHRMSVHGSRRVTNLIFTEHDDSWAWILVHCYHSLVIVIFCKTFLKVASTSYKCTGNTLNDPSQQSFVSVLTCFYVIHLYLYNKKYLVKFI